MNVSFCWSTNTVVSMYGGPSENVILPYISPAVLCMSCLDGFVKGEVSGCCFQDLFKTACSIFVYFLASFISKCFSYAVVMIWLQLGRLCCFIGASIVAKVLNCDIVVSEFKLQWSYYVHFWTNIVGKGINLPLPLLSYRLNSTTTALLQGWLWQKMTHIKLICH